MGHPGGIVVETHLLPLLHVLYPSVSLTLFAVLTIIYPIKAKMHKK